MRRSPDALAAAAALVPLALAALAGCARDDTVTCDGDPPEITRPDDWTRASHCRGVAPDYAEVFDDAALHEFHVAIAGADHAAMMDDLDLLLSGPTSESTDLDALPSPIWVPATVRYGGKIWRAVGMRWKGHASLKGAWNNGVRKLAFILDFDRYEDRYPSLRDQRFYGFKSLIFGNNYNDPSLVREKVAAEVFRAAGVPVARSAFAPVWLDRGDGAGEIYLGMYTVIEDPADAMLAAQFGRHENGEGNLYKPWSDAARWLPPPGAADDATGQAILDWRRDVEAHFEKATNEELADWSDVERLIEKLHGDRNVPAAWRAELESVFDVQSFLDALAVGQVIMNWDSYGCMHHNYYLYADPLDGGRFAWFPWDMNETFLDRDAASDQGECRGAGSVLLHEIVNAAPGYDADWPLIAFLLADDAYLTDYAQALRAVLDGPFAEAEVIARMRRYHDLVAPYVDGTVAAEALPYATTSAEAFAASLAGGEDALEEIVRARRAAVAAALGGE